MIHELALTHEQQDDSGKFSTKGFVRAAVDKVAKDVKLNEAGTAANARKIDELERRLQALEARVRAL